MRTRFAILILAAVVVSGCRSPKDTAFVPRDWHSPPPVQVDTALTKALTYLREHTQDLSRGYDLRAGRGDDHWWFDFLFLPLSPDFQMTIWVYDSGEVHDFPRPLSNETTK